MEDLTERQFGCVPPPPQHCMEHGHVTMAEWMQYINAYIDVRARQMYDKLKGVVGTGDTIVQEAPIKQISVNGSILPITNKRVNITVPENASQLEFDSTISTYSKIESIANDVDQVGDSVSSLSNVVDGVKQDVSSLNGLINQIGSNVSSVQQEVSGVKSNIALIKSDVSNNTTTIGGIKVILDSHIFDDEDDNYLILRDKNDPEKKYKVFIQDGTVCSDEIK